MTKRHGIRNTFKELIRLEVNRESLFKDLVVKYESFISCDAELRVKFVKENSVGPGVCAEMFSSFWEVMENKYLEGNLAKVPVITPDTCSFYFQLGRILSHGYVLTGYLPLFFAKAFFLSLLPTVGSEVDHNIIMESFMDYIDNCESEALSQCLNSQSGQVPECFDGVVVPMLSRFNCRQVPTLEDLRSTLLKVASYTFISQPYFAIRELKQGMLSAHPSLWKKCTKEVIIQAYAMLIPTPQRVLETITEPDFSSHQEQLVFDYLRRFILSLKKEDLCKFMRFITGKPHCGLHPITIVYRKGDTEYTRRPTTHTCSTVLNLPLSYSSETFSTFFKEFHNILDNSFLWSFDFV